jgi:aspartate racemase
MRTIGIIGGMSWESSLLYYRVLNETVRARLGGHHSAKSLMLSVDFAEIERLQRDDRWDEAGVLLADAARALEHGGADLIVLATNTMHKLAGTIAAAVRIPLLHIADATGLRIRAAGLTRVGLLGTRYTMEQDFYAGRLAAEHRLDVRIPDEADRALVHRIIYDELCMGTVRAASRRVYLDVIDRLVAGGAEGVILGCTEIGLLIKPGDCAVPVFDTTRIHAEAAVDAALAPAG